MTEMVLPQFGMGMADGTIIAWHKAVGDKVEVGDTLCDVEAAKTTVEVGATSSGILQQILVSAGTNVPVNTVIAIIGDEAAAPAEITRLSSASEAPVAIVSISPPPQERPVYPAMKEQSGKRLQVEPRARRAASLSRIDLADIQGTGPGGRIVEEDVILFLSTASQPLASKQAAASKASHGLVYQLRMCCEALPLVALLEELGEVYDQPAPVAAVLVKAAALAAVHSGTEGYSIGYRLDNGSVQALEGTETLSVSAIAPRLAFTENGEIQSPALIVAYNSEYWLDEILCIDPTVSASLSFSQVNSHDKVDARLWQVNLIIQDQGMSSAKAKQFLKALRALLLNPLTIFV
ncbi:biotin/lipoyl-containing protein [Sphingorhabdus sp.]|jgi:pyruvate/2-oxoglutarate dehydrogenase complex dihydrolipoamide acyltransferase (E2) component|uniref:biotin/lipoyl-containing protein n=1 Tax=Sphingorhabdus sp. TaxID=1902408 RepID=UPI0037C67F81